MTTHSRRWKALEIRAAESLGGERVTTPWFLFQERPDFIVADFAMIGDCKAYARFAHHRLLENIQAKYCNPGDTPVLVTAEPHKPPLATSRSTRSPSCSTPSGDVSAKLPVESGLRARKKRARGLWCRPVGAQHFKMARATRFELATSAVTGRCVTLGGAIGSSLRVWYGRNAPSTWSEWQTRFLSDTVNRDPAAIKRQLRVMPPDVKLDRYPPN